MPLAIPGSPFQIETSADLRAWNLGGSTLSELDTDGFRIASIQRDSTRRFMRLVVTKDQDGTPPAVGVEIDSETPKSLEATLQT